MSTARSSIAKPAATTLVFGASGYIGTHLVPRLVAERWRVRAGVRNPKAVQARGWAGVDIVAADALKPDTLSAALAGVDVAYYLVHSMASGRNFGRLDIQAADNFARAAEAAGLQRIVYLGGLIPAGARSEHLISRRETGERLRAGRVPVTEIRAGIIVGPGSAAYEVIRDLVNNLPVMITPKWVQSRSSPIALDNMLEYLLRVAREPAAAGCIYEAAGPEYLSYEELMRRFGAVVGRRPAILRAPVLTPQLSSYWLALVTSVPTNVARALVQGLEHDIPAEDAALRRLVPQRLLTYRESVIAALEAERRSSSGPRWVEGGLKFRSQQDYAFYAKRASGSALAGAPPSAVWAEVVGLGGATGYHYMNWIWTLRGVIDWMIGGPGLRRGRPQPNRVSVGDEIDYWTVIGVEPERRLTLQFGMKAPGSGVFELELEPRRDGATQLTATAFWHPAGIWGLLYWYALAPFHTFIFKGMTKAIARRAESLAADHPRGSG